MSASGGQTSRSQGRFSELHIAIATTGHSRKGRDIVARQRQQDVTVVRLGTQLGRGDRLRLRNVA